MNMSKTNVSKTSPRKNNRNFKALLLSTAIAPALLITSGNALAQDDDEDVIIVQGIRASLAGALDEKRRAPSLIEVIKAEDIGKLPDQNLAEVLENVTGIQITRTAGVGTGVQIRGTNANRIEFNGVSTVGSGAGRTGIDFEDVNPAIISAVEVIKVPTAKTIEGSVGGTINLRTIRPNDLGDNLLASVRLQGEQNNLSTEGIQPRFSGALGKNFSTGIGEVGFVVSGSYTKQESVSFRPRTDRDNIASAPGAAFDEYLGIQFLVQEQENFDFETINIAGTAQWAPTDELNFYFDAIINDQERSQDSYRLQASGISNLRNFNPPTDFEIVDFQVGPGEFPAALAGALEPCIGAPGVGQTCNQSDGNLRFSSDTGSRVTDSKVFSVGGEWERDNFSARIEFARTTSDTSNPNLSTTVNFLNPNAPFVTEVRFQDSADEPRLYYALSAAELALVQADFANAAAINAAFEADALAVTGLTPADIRSVTLFNDNATPFVYDLSGDSLAFGINFASPFAPTPEQLLDPNNVYLDQVQVGRNTTENAETAFRADFSYDLVDSFLGELVTSVDAGYRYNKSSSVFDDVGDNIGGFSNLRDAPRGDLFAELLVPGATNYGDADGRTLFIQNFLLIDPDRSFSDPDGTLEILQNAVIAHDPSGPDILNLQSDQNAFYDVTENTHAAYLQANFEHGIIRGNLGLRYVNTSIDSIAFGPADSGGTRSLVSTPGQYDFFLPRFNLTANATENLIVRLGYSSDIRRPDFDDLNTSFTFDTSENSSVSLGNPGLLPEKVDSIDIAVEWYFGPASIFSVGYFTKDRTNIFGQDFEGALLVSDPSTPGGLARETDPTCPGGGIFNPEVIPNVLGDPSTPGLCVDFTQPGNDPAVTTQEGVEVAFQYTLAEFEDSLGFASGFGVLANFTHQTFSGGSEIDSTSGRGLTVLGDVSIERGLLDFSQNAYNATVFYEKYGLSARARYTWREGFRTNDFGGGANTSGSSTFSFPVHTLSRGQLNASIQYAVTEQFSVGVEAVNLTKSRIIQRCVAPTGPTCFVGYPDRRIVFGGSYTF